MKNAWELPDVLYPIIEKHYLDVLLNSMAKLFVLQVIVNRNKAQHDQQNNEYDVSLLHYLIDRLLLGKVVPFPTPTDIPKEDSAIYKHAMVGYATPNATVATR